MWSNANSSPSTEHTRFCWMRPLSTSCSWWKRTSLGDVADNSLTGTLTSPKLTDPLQMALGMPPFFPMAALKRSLIRPYMPSPAAWPTC